MAEIVTARLKLRPAVPADLDAVHRILRDARAMTYWSTPPHDSLDQSREWLAAWIANDPADGEDFIVELDGEVIGKVGLYRFPVIGFIFRPEYWGQGFAAEALRVVLDRAFAVHALPAVVADVDPRNLACLRLLDRLGFEETGRRQRSWLVGDQWCDSVDLQLDAARWRQARA